MMMLSKNLRIIRESRGIGVNELARRSGVNANYISAIENGRRENPSKEILSKIADALEIPVEELLVEKMRTRIDTNLVLHDLNGQYWNPKYISKAFRSELKRYGVQSIRFHDIRHTHATMLQRVGVDPKIISERLGHSDVAFTMQTYTHPSLNHQRAEMLKLKQILSK